MILLLQVIFGLIFVIGIPAGIIQSILHNNQLRSPNYSAEIVPPSKKKGRNGRLPRDSHAQAYVDGFITAEVLDDLGDMFK